MAETIMRLFKRRPPCPTPLPVLDSAGNLNRAIEQAEAVADHVMVSSKETKRRADALTVYAEDVVKHMRKAWGPQ